MLHNSHTDPPFEVTPSYGRKWRKEERKKKVNVICALVFISKINKGNFVTWHMKRMVGACCLNKLFLFCLIKNRLLVVKVTGVVWSFRKRPYAT